MHLDGISELTQRGASWHPVDGIAPSAATRALAVDPHVRTILEAAAIVPLQLVVIAVFGVPRRPSCKTGPAFHPAHPWQACWVKLPTGGECGCTVGVRPPPEPA